MVVSCCVTSLLSKYKLTTILATFFLIIAFSTYTQISHKLLAPLESLEEPIDVVYTWVNGSDPKFLQSLHEYLRINSTTSQDYSNQRYDDKYELKFSLRSLEKYAPWIHHIYIVTNGQIPYWLNLDYEKVTLVSHQEIFTDSFDLPSFSSPAIESHLHRIPGLSRRFIYFNDDIFLGAPLFIDDFVSPSWGFTVYLAWPLPMCAVDCPWVYVGDGQCDSACYNANCQVDGGDCSLTNKLRNSWEENFYYQTTSSQNESRLNGVKYLSVLSSHSNLSNFNETNQRYLSKTKVKSLMRYQLPKLLNNSKVALSNELTTLSSLRLFLRANNVTSNLTRLIQRHNNNLILHDKLRRRKRQYNKRDANVGPLLGLSNNSTLLSKLRSSGASIDAYGASLQHTNRVFNSRYGFRSRYVPAHSPILIDKLVVEDLQSTFGKEFRKTSRNRVRSQDDMQFAFSYYYFLMNEMRNFSAGEIFDRFDTDSSGTWSDREIRTILTKLYDLPLSYATVDHFEELLMNCSRHQTVSDIPTPDFERYVDSKLPTVSKELVVNCQLLSTILQERFGTKHRFKYEIINNAHSSHLIFKMLSSNISEVVGHLDEIRRHTRKFVCLNDNMDDSKVSEKELIRAVLYDFYLSLFPIPSKFELSTDFRNRFLYINELNQWKSYHFRLKVCTYTCIVVLCYVTYCNLFKRRILYRFINKLFC